MGRAPAPARRPRPLPSPPLQSWRAAPQSAFVLPPRNVLIFHQAALGDFVVTWPLAVACGRLFPQSRIIYVTASGKGRLAEHVLGVESVDAESGFAALWGDAANLPPGARRMVESAHAIFSFVADESGAWAANVRAIAPHASVAHLSTRPPDDWSDHVARHVAHKLQATHPAVAAGVGQIIDSLSRRGFGRRPAARSGVLVHPGSGAERKNWPRARFVELARRLRDQSKRPVRVAVGEVEVEKWGDTAIAELAEAAQVVRPQTLVELARLTAEADVVVANDSGPAHLAGILGVPTITLFGPTSDARRWRPLGPAVRVIEGRSLEAIGVDEVYAAASQVLASVDPAGGGGTSGSTADD